MPLIGFTLSQKSTIGCSARITIAMGTQCTYRPSSWRRISATDEVKIVIKSV